MTDKAAIAGDYADFKLVRTRKVCQVIIELPIEKATEVFATIGAPDPAGNKPCAVALLNKIAPVVGVEPGGDSVPSIAAPPGPKKQKWTPAQRAWQLTSNAEFWAFASSFAGMGGPIQSGDQANAWLRHMLGIDSRSVLDENSALGDSARVKFSTIEGQFKAWRLARAHGQLER